MLVASSRNRNLQGLLRYGTKWFSSEVRRPSPYTVLKIKTSATTTDIKSAFRNLAKLYHPDLSTLPAEISKEKMSEIVQAYDQLRKGDLFGARAGDSRVAMACHMFTLEQLKGDNLHDVFGIRLLFQDEFETGGEQSNYRTDGRFLPMTERILDIIVHPDDSVSDLKRQIQHQHEHSLGLGNRAKDRDYIRIGWELTFIEKSDFKHLTVMGNNFLISSYGLSHGDKLYAIVRK